MRYAWTLNVSRWMIGRMSGVIGGVAADFVNNGGRPRCGCAVVGRATGGSPYRFRTITYRDLETILRIVRLRASANDDRTSASIAIGGLALLVALIHPFLSLPHGAFAGASRFADNCKKPRLWVGLIRISLMQTRGGMLATK